jgi:hypothetical protein
MGATVAFPFKPGDDVETKDHSGVSFAVKVFTVIHRYGGPDFAVYGTARLLLADARSIGRIAARRNVIDSQSDYVASTEFAIDSDVEQRQIANATFDLKLSSDGPDVLRAKWRLCADDFSLIPRYALGNVLAGAWDIGHGDLLN